MNDKNTVDASSSELSVVRGRNLAPAIEINRLFHTYGDGAHQQQVLKEITVNIAPSELVMLTGPSGCGKSTLLTLIGALRTVQQGSLKVAGKELKNANTAAQVEVRRNIGFIFQAHNLFESLTAFQNVKMAMELFGYSQKQMKERIERLLEAVDMKDKMHKKSATLSGGEKQRVAVVRGLAHSPKIVLADEPTAALDTKRTMDVISLFETEANEHGTAVLIVTHDQDILERSTRRISLRNGEISDDFYVKDTELCAQWLQKTDSFRDLPAGTLLDIVAAMKPLYFPEGATIVSQGDETKEFYLIGEGRTEVIRDGEKVATLSQGDYFGEIALIEHAPRNATVVTTEASTLYRLDEEPYRNAIESNKDLANRLRKAMAGRR